MDVESYRPYSERRREKNETDRAKLILMDVEQFVPPDDLPLSDWTVTSNSSGMLSSALVACIPACNESQHIGRCLAALNGELADQDGVVVVANGCNDDTVERILEKTAIWRRPWVVIECQWYAGAGSAPLARRFAMDVAHQLAPHATLLSVDGDTVVQPGLRSAYASEFEIGFDLVCGRIGFLPEEAQHLRPSDAVSDAVIREYRDGSRFMASLLMPDSDNPWPNHGNIGGANFAISADAYRQVGTLPTPPSAEDRALRRLCEALGLRIRYSDKPKVETSCRLEGRAAGGLSEELRRNRTEVDPVVDELLEAPAKLLLRLRSRSRFLSATDSDDRKALLLTLGLLPDEANAFAIEGTAMAWFRAEELSPLLARRRLRLSDLRRHLPELRRTLDAIREDRCGSPPFHASL